MTSYDFSYDSQSYDFDSTYTLPLGVSVRFKELGSGVLTFTIESPQLISATRVIYVEFTVSSTIINCVDEPTNAVRGRVGGIEPPVGNGGTSYREGTVA